jgi:hypothetical protein
MIAALNVGTLLRPAIKSAGEVEGKLEGIFLDSDQRSMARDFSMGRW